MTNNFNNAKSLNVLLNENPSFWNKDHLFIGRKKSLEGMLLIIENVEQNPQKYFPENFFSIIEKLLADFDQMILSYESRQPDFYRKYISFRRKKTGDDSSNI